MGILVTDPNVGGGGAPPVADTTLKRLALTPDALAGSAATSALSINQTWNTTGAPSALLVDITDTASDAGSLLANYKVGGVSKGSLKKDGTLLVSGPNSFSSPMLQIGGSGVGFATIDGATRLDVIVANSQILTFSSTFSSFFNTVHCPNLGFDPYGGASDVNMSRPSAGKIRVGVNHATTPTDVEIGAHDVTTGTGAGLTLSGGSGSVSRGSVVLNGGNRAAYDASPSATTVRDILISHGLMAAS